MRKNSKQAVRTQDRIFDDEEVASMVAGNYWSDSDDEDSPMGVGKEDKAETVLLGRKGLNQEFRLE